MNTPHVPYVLILLALVASAFALEWEEAAPMPTPRMDASSAVVGDTLYVMGGRRRGAGGGGDSSGGLQRVVEAYLPSEDRWLTDLPSLPAPRADMACVVVGGRIYLFGGTGTGMTVSEAVWSWAPGEGSWQVEPHTLPAPVRGATAFAAGEGSALVIGGSDATGSYLAWVLRFDPRVGFSVEPSLSQARSGACGDTLGGMPLVTGGYFHGPLASTEVLTADAWEGGPPLPSARGGALACRLETGLLVLGGQGATGTLDEVLCLESPDGEWQAEGSMRYHRARLAGGAVGRYLVAAGGMGRMGYEAIGSCERASIASSSPEDHTVPSHPALTLHAWPNPFTDVVFLRASFDDDEPWTLSVYRQDGARVHRCWGRSASLNLRLPLSDELPCGAYLVVLESGSRSATLRIVRVR